MRCFASLFAFACLLSSPLVHAAELASAGPKGLIESLDSRKKLAPDKKLRLTLKGEVGPAEIVAALAPLSCRPLVLGGGVSRAGKVSIEAPDLMTPMEATRILVSALDSMGLSIEQAGSILRVVDSARGREIATALGASDRLRGREASVRWKNDWTVNNRTVSLLGYPIFEIPVDVYHWRSGPFDYTINTENIEHPGTDYLHAYWLGLFDATE